MWHGIYRGGDWRTGGSCHMETLPELGSSLVPPQTWDHYNIFGDALSAQSNKSVLGTLDILNITIMTSRRKDGHSSLYYLGPKLGPAPHHRQDCSHWCLPGVPDAWNELLYALFLKREISRDWNSNSSTFQAPFWIGENILFIRKLDITRASPHRNEYISKSCTSIWIFSLEFCSQGKRSSKSPRD